MIWWCLMTGSRHERRRKGAKKKIRGSEGIRNISSATLSFLLIFASSPLFLLTSGHQIMMHSIHIWPSGKIRRWKGEWRISSRIKSFRLIFWSKTHLTWADERRMWVDDQKASHGEEERENLMIRSDLFLLLEYRVSLHRVASSLVHYVRPFYHRLLFSSSRGKFGDPWISCYSFTTSHLLPIRSWSTLYCHYVPDDPLSTHYVMVLLTDDGWTTALSSENPRGWYWCSSFFSHHDRSWGRGALNDRR